MNISLSIVFAIKPPLHIRLVLTRLEPLLDSKLDSQFGFGLACTILILTVSTQGQPGKEGQREKQEKGRRTYVKLGFQGVQLRVEFLRELLNLLSYRPPRSLVHAVK